MVNTNAEATAPASSNPAWFTLDAKYRRFGDEWKGSGTLLPRVDAEAIARRSKCTLSHQALQQASAAPTPARYPKHSCLPASAMAASQRKADKSTTYQSRSRSPASSAALTSPPSPAARQRSSHSDSMAAISRIATVTARRPLGVSLTSRARPSAGSATRST